jgi:hypothetical protein
MSSTSRVFTAAAVLTLAGGLSRLGAMAASAATPQCSAVNQNCVEVYSMKYATRTHRTWYRPR